MNNMKKRLLELNVSKGYSYSSANFNEADINFEFINVVDIKDIETVYSKLEGKTYSPTAKDKLYFYPECTVPRFKIREYWNPKKVAVTIKEDNATHRFISANKSKYTETMGNYMITKTASIKKWLEFNKPLFEKYNLESFIYDNFDQEVKDYFDNNEELLVNWSFDNILTGSSSSHFTGIDSNGGAVSFPARSMATIGLSYYSSAYTATLIKEDNIASAIEDIFNGNDSLYYLDEAVNRALQDESTVIDEPMYDQLVNLFNSTDSDNHTMAMEIMANSNVEKSAGYIYKLFMKYNSTKMIYSSSYNSVNFTALRDSVGVSRYTSFDDDGYIQFLYNFNQLSIDTVNEIREKAIEIAEAAIQHHYRSILHKDILSFEIPFMGITLKGVNDGTQTVTIINEEQTPEEIIASNPAKYDPNYAVPVSSPCANHDLQSEEQVETPLVTYENKVETISDNTTISTDDITSEVSEMENEITETDIEQVEMQTSEVIKEEVEIFPGTMNELEEISNFKADEEMQEIKTEVIMKEREKSVFEPIAQALKPDSDNWWEAGESVENPFD